MKQKIKLVFLFMMFMLLSIFYGCGKEIEKNPTSVVSEKGDFLYVTIKGKVAFPLSDSIEDGHQKISLGGIQGTLVFLENRSDLYAYTDSKGEFSISNVPIGNYSIIAEKNDGYCIYKQRVNNIEINGNESVYKLELAIPLEAADYSLELHLQSLLDESPVEGSLTIWGRTFHTYDGGVKLSSFPGGTSKKEVLIVANGYQQEKIELIFGENRNSHIYVRLTPENASSNKAPVVSIEQSLNKIKIGDNVRFTASVYEPDGEEVTLKWEANRGNLLNNNTNTVIYNTPNSIGPEIITVIAEDVKGNKGKAILKLNIENKE